jgi:hypothetical protein
MDLTSWAGRAEDGATVTVWMPPALRSELQDVLPPFGLEAQAGVPVPTHLTVTVTGSSVVDAAVEIRSDASDDEVRVGGWHRLESELGLFAAEHLVGRVAVHAGVVVWREQGLVLPGPSFAGKSTLCQALAARGAVVLSDEYAIVEPASGTVSAWPRPLRMRRADGSIDRVPLAGHDPGPVRVTLIAAIAYEPEQRVVLQEASRAEAVIALVANTVTARTRPESAFEAATSLARGATAVNGWRGEASVAADALLTRLETGPPTGE